MSNINPLTDILERIVTLHRNEVRLVGVEYGLHPVHLEVLYYLSRCNKFSDTPAAVTEFLGITKGTTSQSITLLASKGFLTKRKDPHDRRVTHLVLTEKGEEIAKTAIPPTVLKNGLEQLGESQQALRELLETLLRSMQKTTNSASFGLCKTCKFHQPIADGKFFCTLTKETLDAAGRELICREHTLD
ncbi:MarR family winged helix-turn-helix transcriptional regulator [Grimontia kaedaensis]|uniref:MarR family winged helix-turn-helix transcriptional regulator n=1 Tax=Grimontia kaedaensis TaxID=2872157 RepID=A0ABY4WV60_9GAMM|nr:MarR family winged helix-turn-helix transcriptional regulator [Grimontia kaedaensis]USH02226.1 MarR family winged helix-turn-helix transcriptional regulator [Grimontia kaedaensis]